MGRCETSAQTTPRSREVAQEHKLGPKFRRPSRQNICEFVFAVKHLIQNDLLDVYKALAKATKNGQAGCEVGKSTIAYFICVCQEGAI